MGQIIDLTNKKFGRLTVLKQAEQKIGRYIAWDCICECGNPKTVRGDCLRNGTTKSCGCLQKENGKKMIALNSIPIKDLKGQKFGLLTVLSLEKDKNNNSIWRCLCDCGNETYAYTYQLTSARKKSCGCIHYNDYKGRRFGRLVVIEKAEKSQMGTYYWLCKCDCGSLVKVVGNNLQNGHTQSCGCLLSKGEEKISQILTKNNIPFIREKKFDTCISEKNSAYRFDFFVNNQYIIEYDGIQHFIDKNGWGNEKQFEQTKESDIYKTVWCKNHSIPLIRIPYTHYDNLCLEDLMIETSKYLLKE